MIGLRLEGSVFVADRNQQLICLSCGDQFYGRFRLLYETNQDANELFDKLREVEYTCEKCLTLIRFKE
jgi:DNA-directed RNA polymerase subunit N (RpoN/RPB10)